MVFGTLQPWERIKHQNAASGCFWRCSFWCINQTISINQTFCINKTTCKISIWRQFFCINKTQNMERKKHRGHGMKWHIFSRDVFFFWAQLREKSETSKLKITRYNVHFKKTFTLQQQKRMSHSRHVRDPLHSVTPMVDPSRVMSKSKQTYKISSNLCFKIWWNPDCWHATHSHKDEPLPMIIHFYPFTHSLSVTLSPTLISHLYFGVHCVLSPAGVLTIRERGTISAIHGDPARRLVVHDNRARGAQKSWGGGDEYILCEKSIKPKIEQC